jgi:hypothetical protein
MAQSIPQGAMRVVLNGFFAAIHGIMSMACKKLLPFTFTTPIPPEYMQAAGTVKTA